MNRSERFCRPLPNRLAMSPFRGMEILCIQQSRQLGILSSLLITVSQQFIVHDWLCQDLKGLMILQIWIQGYSYEIIVIFDINM